MVIQDYSISHDDLNTGNFLKGVVFFMKIKVNQDLSADDKKIKKEYRNIGCKLTIGWE